MLTDAEVGKCYKFAYEVTKRTEQYYKQRNNYASTEKLISDAFIAKMAELVVYNHLKENFYQCTYPDFSIATFKETGSERFTQYSNDADLVVMKDGEQIKMHIKCVRFDSPVTDSWLIQSNSKSLINPDENEYFALCVFYSPSKILIKKIIQAKKVKWKSTKNNLPTKKACYLSDLEK